MNLNSQAADICRQMATRSEQLRVQVHRASDGSRIIDCGVKAKGGIEAGRMLSEAAMADLGHIQLLPSNPSCHFPCVVVRTDHPVAACMASQYAGWQISLGNYFAMGSGPMRALASKEELFRQIGCQESGNEAVGVLETAKIPPAEVCRHIASECGVDASNLTLLVAPTASQAGTFQIVARSIETALHKLHELGFDLSQIESGMGSAPLPPVAKSDLTAMGRTNDAILYGGEVVLWVRTSDDAISSLGPKVPSEASADHGQPFLRIFERYDRDFYKIDPGLFAPAMVSFFNMETGASFRFGSTMPELVNASFTSGQ